MVKGRSEDVKSVAAGSQWKPVIAPTLALIAVGVLPPLMKGLYEPLTDKLMAAYVAFGLLFITTICGGLALMVFRDLSSRKTKVFRLAPGEQPVSSEDGAVRVTEDRFDR